MSDIPEDGQVTLKDVVWLTREVNYIRQYSNKYAANGTFI
jgi:hypothetical protein